MRLILFLTMVAPAAAQWVTIRAENGRTPPAWALAERQLIASLNRAARIYVKTYTKADGSLRFKERYEGGMNSSDDAYEAFRGLSMVTAIGGDPEADRLHRIVWNGITKQFTRYGQIYREFDSNWDWMHHGEGYTSFYSFGLVNPHDALFRDRAVRFSAMYTGDDPESKNYDPERNIIRAVMNGSRGPKMSWNTRDWIPTNANLVYYQLPYDDIPGVKSPEGWINDDQFPAIVKTMSDRMARGDVPINLTSTPLVTSAYLYTGDERYKRWVLRYIEGWEERTRANGGITPDNVGLSGKVGEYTNGNWWGGYYGWRWPRGGADIYRAEITAAGAAHLLTGDTKWFDLPRSQLELIAKQGRNENGVWVVPARHDQHGWYLYGPEPVYPYIKMWLHTFDERDWRHIERATKARKPRAAGPDADMAWVEYLRGASPDYPLQALTHDLDDVRAKLAEVLNEHGDPETWVDSKWSQMDPLTLDALTRLTLGASPIDLRGEMLHARLRYFDAERRRPGLPEGVAALIASMSRENTKLELVNTNVAERRRVLVSAGAYGEHRFESANGRAIGASLLEIDLAPDAGVTLDLAMKCWVNRPTYIDPWGTK